MSVKPTAGSRGVKTGLAPTPMPLAAPPGLVEQLAQNAMAYRRLLEASRPLVGWCDSTCLSYPTPQPSTAKLKPVAAAAAHDSGGQRLNPFTDPSIVPAESRQGSIVSLNSSSNRSQLSASSPPLQITEVEFDCERLRVLLGRFELMLFESTTLKSVSALPYRTMTRPPHLAISGGQGGSDSLAVTDGGAVQVVVYIDVCLPTSGAQPVGRSVPNRQATGHRGGRSTVSSRRSTVALPFATVQDALTFVNSCGVLYLAYKDPKAMTTAVDATGGSALAGGQLSPGVTSQVTSTQNLLKEQPSLLSAAGGSSSGGGSSGDDRTMLPAPSLSTNTTSSGMRSPDGKGISGSYPSFGPVQRTMTVAYRKESSSSSSAFQTGSGHAYLGQKSTSTVTGGGSFLSVGRATSFDMTTTASSYVQPEQRSRRLLSSSDDVAPSPVVAPSDDSASTLPLPPHPTLIVDTPSTTFQPATASTPQQGGATPPALSLPASVPEGNDEDAEAARRRRNQETMRATNTLRDSNLTSPAEVLADYVATCAIQVAVGVMDIARRDTRLEPLTIVARAPDPPATSVATSTDDLIPDAEDDVVSPCVAAKSGGVPMDATAWGLVEDDIASESFDRIRFWVLDVNEEGARRRRRPQPFSSHTTTTMMHRGGGGSAGRSLGAEWMQRVLSVASHAAADMYRWCSTVDESSAADLIKPPSLLLRLVFVSTAAKMDDIIRSRCPLVGTGPHRLLSDLRDRQRRSAMRDHCDAVDDDEEGRRGDPSSKPQQSLFPLADPFFFSAAVGADRGGATAALSDVGHGIVGCRISPWTDLTPVLRVLEHILHLLAKNYRPHPRRASPEPLRLSVEWIGPFPCMDDACLVQLLHLLATPTWFGPSPIAPAHAVELVSLSRMLVVGCARPALAAQAAIARFVQTRVADVTETQFSDDGGLVYFSSM